LRFIDRAAQGARDFDLSARGESAAAPEEVFWVLRFEQRISRFLAGAALAGATGAGFFLPPAAASAQSAPVVSRPVVQAVPSADSDTLNDALARLGRNPRDANALIDAGDAARGLGDYDAAIGFYRRADELASRDPRIKAGMASALVFKGDPVAAISEFREAEQAGVRPQAIAADRGLAYDLVGDNLAAQRYYRTALGGSDDGELRMRLAISQAIGGDVDTAEQTLMPLLRKQDKPGWRTRAFTLAIVGRTKEAVDLANTILPAKLAQSIAPYLRYMPRLTKAQQAAAANLGKFPRASEIGQDDPKIAAYRPAPVAAVAAATVPKVPSMGNKGSAWKSSKSSKDSSQSGMAKVQAAEAKHQAEVAENRRKAALASAEADRVAPPEPKPGIERAGSELPAVDTNGELPPVSSSAASNPRAVSAMAAASPAPAATVPTAPAAAPRPAIASTPAPGFDLARVGSQPPAPAQPAAPAPAAPARQPVAAAQEQDVPPEPGPNQASLDEIFADLGKPTMQAVPASGAVDIRKIEPAKPKPKEEPKPVEKPKKPAPPAHPSRIWVQIGVGRDKDAIAFDWRRHTRETPELFKGRQAYVSEMGQTNRILMGPFETSKAANEFVVDLRKAGVGGAFPWTSPAGQVVDQLPTK
jgi:tetratricopeptide (TPR) repeat protein